MIQLYLSSLRHLTLLLLICSFWNTHLLWVPWYLLFFSSFSSTLWAILFTESFTLLILKCLFFMFYPQLSSLHLQVIGEKKTYAFSWLCVLPTCWLFPDIYSQSRSILWCSGPCYDSNCVSVNSYQISIVAEILLFMD